jgi:hypothetical protein
MGTFTGVDIYYFIYDNAEPDLFHNKENPGNVKTRRVRFYADVCKKSGNQEP